MFKLIEGFQGPTEHSTKQTLKTNEEKWPPTMKKMQIFSTPTTTPYSIEDQHVKEPPFQLHTTPN